MTGVVIAHSSHHHAIGHYSAACDTCRENPPRTSPRPRYDLSVDTADFDRGMALLQECLVYRRRTRWRRLWAWAQRPIPTHKLWALLLLLTLIGHAWSVAGAPAAGGTLLLFVGIIVLIELSGGVPPQAQGKVTSRDNPHGGPVDRREWIR